MKFINLLGNKFNKLTVLSFKDKQNNHIRYECVCDCGTSVIVKGIHLKSNHTTSCGCVNRENTRARNISKGRNFNKVLFYYKRNAKRRNIQFELTEQEFNDIRNKNCTYCGNIGPNGIDRVDNNLGYLLTNCVPCCTVCNKAKDVMSVEQFKNWITKVYKELINGN